MSVEQGGPGVKCVSFFFSESCEKMRLIDLFLHGRRIIKLFNNRRNTSHGTPTQPQFMGILGRGLLHAP